MRMKLLFFLVIPLMFPTLVLAEIMTVSFSGTEMRSAPNAMASKKIAELSTYTPLNVIEKGTEYFKVKDYRGRTGWVHRSLLNSKTSIVVTEDRANVRQGPGTSHSVAFQLTKGDACRVTAKEEKWIEVLTADGRRGWVAEFLTWGQ